MAIQYRLKHITLLGYFAAIIVLIVLHSMIGGIKHLPTIANIVVYVMAALVVLADRLKLDRLFVTFILYIALSIAIVSPSSVFHPWIRFGVFAFLYVFASGLVKTDRACLLREYCLKTILAFCILASIGSFIAYFLGINFFVDRFEGGYWLNYRGAAGKFSGLLTHSMLLGPVSGLSVVSLFYLLITRRKKVLWIPLIICAGALLFSSSRGAVIATIAGAIVVLYCTSINFSHFFNKAIILILALLLTFPLWEFATEALVSKKNLREENETGLFDSRSEKISIRIEEFKSSPIFGIGFSSVDTELDEYSEDTGTIEPGSSWFAVLSMTGVIGFILFLIIICQSFKYSFRDESKYLVCGLLAFFAIHLLFEGYVFAFNSPLCFIFWIVLGNAFNPGLEQYE